MNPPGNYGEQFTFAVREYLVSNGLKSLGQINATVLAELAQRFHEKHTAAQKTKRRLANEEDWLKEMESDPAMQGIDVRRELGKCQFWCKQRGFVCTRRRFTNWILKAERPVGHTYDGASSRPKPVQAKAVYSVEIPVPAWSMLLRYGTQFDLTEAEIDRLCALDWHELPVGLREKLIQVA
tara:strand:+ start:544 stop:1086 length:543 start_codon:yes stop_codon:yes gene_type:complete